MKIMMTMIWLMVELGKMREERPLRFQARRRRLPLPLGSPARSVCMRPWTCSRCCPVWESLLEAPDGTRVFVRDACCSLRQRRHGRLSRPSHSRPSPQSKMLLRRVRECRASCQRAPHPSPSKRLHRRRRFPDPTGTENRHWTVAHQEASLVSPRENYGPWFLCGRRIS